MNKLMVALVVLVAVVGVACEDEVSKLDLCVRMGKAYCAQEKAVGCLDPSSPCVSDECYNYFDDGCAASTEEIEQIDHDIEMIIQTKTTCDSLRSVDGYLLDSVYSLAAGVCAGGGNSDYPTKGEMCTRLITSYCSKIVELGCAAATVEGCVDYSFQTGAATIGDNYYCTTPDDPAYPTSVQVLTLQQALEEIEAATTCE